MTVTPRPTGLGAAHWIATADPAGLLYGAIVSAAVLATVTAHADDAVYVGVATGFVLVISWLAHVYTDTLSRQFDGDDRRFFLRMGTAAAHESGVLKGGLPAIVVYVLAHTAGVDTGSSAALAVYFSVALLAGVGYLGARRVGLKGRAVLVEMAGAASFGLVIVAAKTLLH